MQSQLHSSSKSTISSFKELSKRMKTKFKKMNEIDMSLLTMKGHVQPHVFEVDIHSGYQHENLFKQKVLALLVQVCRKKKYNIKTKTIPCQQKSISRKKCFKNKTIIF